MPILDIQKRARELGRIRIGQVVAGTNRKGEAITRPEKLDRFRLTSHSKPLLDKVAELYGGTVTEWQPQGGGVKAWEVVTDSNRLPIMVPPQPVTQWYEFWTAGGCKHRCDGHTNVLTDELCDPEDYGHREAIKRPTTRLNVVLRDVEGIGVWRLETHGFNAAVELPDAAEFLARAGGYVNGWVSLEARTSKAEVVKNGESKIETRHFMVPIIEIDVTPAELMAGKGRVQTPELEGPVPQPAALEAGQPAAEPAADLYAPAFDLVAQATDLDRLAWIWDRAKELNLVGITSAESPRRDEFITAWKAKAHELQATAGADQSPPPAAAATGQSNTDGVVDAELVDDGDADAVWRRILAAGGQQGMSLGDVQDDFLVKMGGLSSADASASELTHYLGLLTGERAA